MQLLGLRPEQLEALLTAMGESPAKARSIFAWAYREQHLIREFAEAKGEPKYQLSNALIHKLTEVCTLDPGLRLEDVRTAADGTRKLLFRVTEGPGAGQTPNQPPCLAEPRAESPCVP